MICTVQYAGALRCGREGKGVGPEGGGGLGDGGWVLVRLERVCLCLFLFCLGCDIYYGMTWEYMEVEGVVFGFVVGFMGKFKVRFV